MTRQNDSPVGPSSNFEYDAKVPLDVLVTQRATGLSSRVQEVEYSSQGRRVRGIRVDPLLTVPTGRAVFLHAAGGSPAQFLAEADVLASRGIASLLIEAPWSDIARMSALNEPDSIRTMMTSAVVDARRAADLLTSGRPGGVAFIGHGLGAMVGSMLTAVDGRFRAAVLMGGAGRMADLVGCIPGAGTEALSDLDPARHIRSAKYASFLFQLGLADHQFTRSQLVSYFEAAGGSKDVMWYEADHDSIIDAGRAERVEWLDVRIQAMG